MSHWSRCGAKVFVSDTGVTKHIIMWLQKGPFSPLEKAYQGVIAWGK